MQIHRDGLCYRGGAAADGSFCQGVEEAALSEIDAVIAWASGV